MGEDKQGRFDWGLVFNGLICLFLAASLFLFIRNNRLLASGGKSLRHPDVIIMLGVLGIPLVLVILHVIRHMRS